MRALKLLIGLAAASLIPAAASAEGKPLPYPPADQPLYLECAMKGVQENTPPQVWPKLVLYFPEGSDGGFPELKIVDAHNQLEGGAYGFSIKAEGHWSLIDSAGVPNGEAVSELPQIMFLPPEGPANLTILFMKDEDVVRSGVCFGMIGPNTADAYARAAAEPSSLDE